VKRTKGEEIYAVFNTILLTLIAITCIFPLVNIIALSFSDAQRIAGIPFTLWPVGLTLESYKHIVNQSGFFISFWVSVKRVVIGLPINMAVIILVAYPLSKSNQAFPGRTFFTWLFMISMLFTGGLIPTFMTVKMTGIMDTIWALILPGTVPAYLIVLMLNFFRSIPIEMEEAAMIDGASHWRIVARIYLPVSKPGIATIALLSGIGHWNAWFDGLIYMNKMNNYPLQTYLQTTMINQDMLSGIRDPEMLRALMSMNLRTVESAQILIAMIPVMIIYPFVQRYFVKGIVIGSVKG